MNDSSRVNSELPTMSINGLIKRLSNITQLSKASFTKKKAPYSIEFYTFKTRITDKRELRTERFEKPY